MSMRVFQIAAIAPRVSLGRPELNIKGILQAYRQACREECALLATPELSLCGATCGDALRLQNMLIDCAQALDVLRLETEGQSTALIVGCPIVLQNKLYNCAVVLQDGQIQGITAKRRLSPAESRIFVPGPEEIQICDYDAEGQIPFGNQLLYRTDDFSFIVTIGQDYKNAGQYANLSINLNALPVLAGQFSYLREEAIAASRRENDARLIISAGMGESTSANAYGGQIVGAISGELKIDRAPFAPNDEIATMGLVPSWLETSRRRTAFPLIDDDNNWSECVLSSVLPYCGNLASLQLRALPFLPSSPEAMAVRAQEILQIQAQGLAQRVSHTRSQRLVLGISGGLDSTMALLVCQECCRLLDKKNDFILAVTMPGLGTTDRTKNNACDLVKAMGAELREISIASAVKQHFKDIDHDPKNLNVAYENSQARERTQILMDLANDENGLVIGTGDLSEIALGWCTYNGDQMSMYSVNSSLPKTLIRAIVTNLAKTGKNKTISRCLQDIVDTPVSPELIPGGQFTEKIVGSYELHDFFLYYLLKYNLDFADLLPLAEFVFKKRYSKQEMERTLQLFHRRFITQQFKRNAAPDGVRTGSLSLDAKSDWVMPSDIML